MEPSIGATIRNFQTRYCVGRLKKPKQNLTENDLSEAIGFIRGTPLVGMIEVFDESMVLFENALRTWYPDIDLSYVIQNVGRNDERETIKKIESIKKDLGPEIYRVLENNNDYDLMLYSEAKSLIHDRISHTGQFEYQLIDFRERCTRLKSLPKEGIALKSQKRESTPGNSRLSRFSARLREMLK
jgi:hypothetical protein